jgi:ankyrin repeat protein
MEEVNMTELGVTVTMLQTICEAIESAEFDEDVSLDDLGYGPLTVSQLNVLLLEASGPNSLEYEEICGTPLNLQVMELLLERGADMECSDGEGSTPLYRSVLHDQIREMQFLLEKGARTDALFYVPHDEAGESCLSTAIQLGNHDMVILLLKYGANLRSPPGILFFAAADSDVDMVRLLIDAGEDVLQMNPATELSLCDTAFA